MCYVGTRSGPILCGAHLDGSRRSEGFEWATRTRAPGKHGVMSIEGTGTMKLSSGRRLHPVLIRYSPPRTPLEVSLELRGGLGGQLYLQRQPCQQVSLIEVSLGCIL